MIRPNRCPRLLGFALSLLCALLAGATAAGAAPTSGNPAGPVLTAAAAQGDAPGTIVVTGEAFTPGGRVYLALYGRSGARPDETRLGAAAPTVYGKNGSVDPAGEPGRAVAFGAAVGDWLSAGPAVYGRGNSADPAAGFVPRGTVSVAFLIPCGEAVTVRAFDRGTDSWSNPVAARPGC